MPYVPVPKDLTKVKTKLAFNLTKRQLICFSLAGLVGLPVYFFTRGAIGNSAAVLLMIGLMMPFFFFAMYERDGQAVLANKQKKMQEKMRKEGTPLPCGCPGSQSRSIRHTETRQAETVCAEPVSRLSQWPVQIKLVPVRAPYFDGAKLLIAADCTAYAYAAFHERFIKGHITLVGCPKLDGVDYAEKLTEIIRSNDIQSVTIVRMEVPCCGGLEHAAKTALQQSGKFIPWQVVTISTDGRILD